MIVQYNSITNIQIHYTESSQSCGKCYHTVKQSQRHNLVGSRGVLGDSSGTFGDGVLSQFTRQDQSDGGLDLSGRNGGLLVVSSQLGGLGGDSLENVVDERVHDRHGLLGDTSVWVSLLQDLVDVRRVSFLSSLGLSLWLTGRSGLLGGWFLLGWGLGSWFLFCLWCHGI